MSQSQEAASAVRMLEQQAADLGRTIGKLKDEMNKHLADVVEARAQEREAVAAYSARVPQLEMAARELGRIQGAIAAMNNPRGYGGAPTWPPTPTPERIPDRRYRDNRAPLGGTDVLRWENGQPIHRPGTCSDARCQRR